MLGVCEYVSNSVCKKRVQTKCKYVCEELMKCTADLWAYSNSLNFMDKYIIRPKGLRGGLSHGHLFVGLQWEEKNQLMQ